MAFTFIQLGESDSGSSSTNADVNLHDGAGLPITSTSGALDVNLDNADISVEISAADGDNIAIKDSTGTNALAISASGAAKVDGSAVTQPISGSLTTVSTVTNLTQLNGAAISMGTGTRDSGTQRVTIATNDVVPVTQSAAPWNINNISGTISLPTGAATLGFQASTKLVVDNIASNVESCKNDLINIDSILAQLCRDNGDPPFQFIAAGGMDRPNNLVYYIPLTNLGAAVKTDSSATTQPISAASLPLPSGAATAANQTNVQYTDGAGVGTGLYVQGLDVANGQVFGIPLTDGGAEVVVRNAGGTINITSLPINFQTRQDTFTGTTNGTTVNISTTPLAKFAVQVKGTGASATTWDVRLEGSLDGTNFSQILQHTNTDLDGTVKYPGSNLAPSLYFRSRCAGLSLGGASNIVVTILGLE